MEERKRYQPDKEHIGHVSVKPHGREKWESKLSTCGIVRFPLVFLLVRRARRYVDYLQVLLHEELLFEDYKWEKENLKLRPAVYFKKA